MQYERHYFSSCWPDITGEEYEHLKDSIYVSGLRDAITLYEGQILDGWNRYRACNDMVMPAHYVEFEGTPEEAEQFVQDKHNRRSLTLTQRLTCIGLMRQRPSVGRPKNTEGPSVLTAKDMAKKAGSSVRYAEHVNEAIAKGAPELVESMKSGKVGAEKAAVISKLPKDQQAAALDKPLPKAAALHKPAPKPALQEPKLDDLALTDADLIEEMQETQAENKQLLERVELMSSDNKAAEIDKLLTRISGLEGRINQLMMQVKTSADSEKYHATVIHKLRKLLGVEGHKEIIAAVTELVADRRLAA